MTENCAAEIPSGKHVLRPHPAVWRFIHAVGIFYLYGLALMAVMPQEYGRKFLGLIFPSTVAEKPQKNDTFGDWHLQCAMTPATM